MNRSPPTPDPTCVGCRHREEPPSGIGSADRSPPLGKNVEATNLDLGAATPEDPARVGA